MGNILSQLENELGIGAGPATAPSASYTITPAPEKTITTSTTTSQSPNTCNSDSTTTSTTTTQNSPSSGSVPFTGASNSTTTQIRDEIFNSTTFSILFWIIAIYTVYKLGTAIFASRESSNASSSQLSYSRTIDLILAACLMMYMFYWYTSLTESEQGNMLGYSISWAQESLNDPWTLFELIWFTIIFFTLVYILRVPMAPGASPVLVHLVESKIWILYAIIGLIYFFKYVLGISIVDLLFNNSLMNYFKNAQPSTSSIYNTLSKDLDDVENDLDPTTTTTTNTSPAPCNDNQVFNVSNNLYTYEEAQSVCNAFDASLATYDQIENSYNSGGEWCNYGWSEGQMAYFPTQKSTWSALQNNPKTQNSCGRPGINGGFIDNPYVRFGANCYGVKPKQPENWIPPSYDQELEIENDKYAELRNGVTINSFNATEWSKY
jgi:hypothetical protein